MKKLFVIFIFFLFSGQALAQEGIYFIPKQDYSTSGRPIAMNVVMVDPNSNYKPELYFGSENINSLMKLEDLVRNSGAYAAINASYFKQDTGTPLGLTIVNGRMMTGPLMNRSVFGIDEDGRFHIGKVTLEGKIAIGNNDSVPIKNINQPIMTSQGAHLYNIHWGDTTPCTSNEFWHIAIDKSRIVAICECPVKIPPAGFAIVVKKSFLAYTPQYYEYVKYCYSLYPKEWCKMKCAFAAGPNLVVNGKKCVDFEEQKFTAPFANTRTARSAIGIKRDGTIILLAVDGKQKGISEGVTLSEMADIMLNMGACQAMNLDGGSSTQMVVCGQLVNVPTNKIGAKVTNAVIIVKKQ